jgi:hypothetical protein
VFLLPLILVTMIILCSICRWGFLFINEIQQWMDFP